MDKRLDRVAEAIYEAWRPNHHADWTYLKDKPEMADFWREVARAALAAIDSKD